MFIAITIFYLNKRKNHENTGINTKPPWLSIYSSVFEYSNFDPFKSKISTQQQPIQLIKLCEFGLKDSFKLLYRASEHGFASNDFHSKFDGKANTMTILKANRSLFIFGGFTTASWYGSGLYKSDPNAFFLVLQTTTINHAK